MDKCPKYVQKLLDRRYRLAMNLIGVCADVDEYLEKLGILDDGEISDATNSGCMIYCEPGVARRIVFEKIEETLEKR